MTEPVAIEVKKKYHRYHEAVGGPDFFDQVTKYPFGSGRLSQGGLQDDGLVFSAIGLFKFMHPHIEPGEVAFRGFEVGMAMDFQVDFQ